MLAGLPKVCLDGFTDCAVDILSIRHGGFVQLRRRPMAVKCSLPA